MKYIDTKSDLAAMFTKGNFARDEWNHFHRLFNILSFSVFSQPSQINNKSKIMPKRQQEGKSGEEKGVVAKAKPMISFGVGDRKSVSNTGFGCT